MAWFRWGCVGAAGLVLVACTGRDAESGPVEDTEGAVLTSGASAGDSGATTDAGGSGPATTGAPTTGPGEPAICEGSGDGWGGEESGGGSTGGGDGTGTDSFGMDDDMPLVANTFDIQQGVFGPGDLVALDSVLLTTPSTLTETGSGYEVFVQDPAGGAWSGVRVRVLGFDPMDVAGVGESLNVVGRVYQRDGFYLVHVSGVGTGITAGPAIPLPPPVVLSAADLLPGNDTARPYEGVPIRVEQVEVTDDDPCDGEFEIEQTARVDDRFVPEGIEAPPVGTMLDGVQGVLIYAVDAFEIAPRDATEIE